MQNAPLTLAVDALYAAAAGLEDWPSALHKLARSAEAVGVIVFPHDVRDAADPFPVSTDLAEPADAYMRAGWWQQDYRMNKAGELLKTPFIVEHQISSSYIREQHPYYQFLRSWGFRWWSCLPFHIDDRLWTFTFQRGFDQPYYTPQDGPELIAAMPAMTLAFTLARRLDRSAGAAQLALLDRFTCGAVLLDWSGAVVQLNGRADALIGSDLFICNRRLTARDRAGDEKLQALIRSARAREPGQRTSIAPAAIRREGKPPLLLQAFPIVSGMVDLFNKAHAIVTLVEPGSAPRPSEAVLQSAFGLTPAEARLAARIAHGETLEDAAEASGVLKSTAAQQLKAVFAKTDTHRQSQLVALLAPLILVAAPPA